MSDNPSLDGDEPVRRTLFRDNHDIEALFMDLAVGDDTDYRFTDEDSLDGDEEFPFGNDDHVRDVEELIYPQESSDYGNLEILRDWYDRQDIINPDDDR